MLIAVEEAFCELRLERLFEKCWTGRTARLSVARGTEKVTFTLVAQALGTTKWILSGISRQSL